MVSIPVSASAVILSFLGGGREEIIVSSSSSSSSSMRSLLSSCLITACSSWRDCSSSISTGLGLDLKGPLLVDPQVELGSGFLLNTANSSRSRDLCMSVVLKFNLQVDASRECSQWSLTAIVPKSWSSGLGLLHVTSSAIKSVSDGMNRHTLNIQVTRNDRDGMVAYRGAIHVASDPLTIKVVFCHDGVATFEVPTVHAGKVHSYAEVGTRYGFDIFDDAGW
ncbi:hypothetical protein KCU83_g30, partial [Aureobasidium melanogenum]